MKELTLDDYNIIKAYIDLGDYEGYNSNFATMIMWNHEYHIQYEICDQFMVMLHDYKGIKFWSMPFTDRNHYKPAIEYMLQYSHKHNFEFIIECATKDFIEEVEKIYKDRFLFKRLRDSDDYIYDRFMHQNLTGKKMQKRRNHYNYFNKHYPNYIYRDLDPVEDFGIILECLTKWEQEQDTLSESMMSEVRGIITLISAYKKINIKIGGIFIDNRIEAFIIASQLPHSTIQIHVEKANKNIRGLYPAILKEFLDHNFLDDKYINREEDMGLENLRKSKESLHPIKMIKKYRVMEKNLFITQAIEEQTDIVKDLWLDTFEDETASTTDFYFQHLYAPENTYVLKNNNEVISMLQIRPMNISHNCKVELSYFILGVLTKKEYEGQGCMTYLMNYIIKKYSNYPLYLQAYHPEIYYKFGFHVSHMHKVFTLDLETIKEAPLIPDGKVSNLIKLYNQFNQHYNLYKIRDINDWNIYIQQILANGYQIKIFKNKGYFIYENKDKIIYISEIIYLKEDYLYGMLSTLKDDNKRLIIETDLKCQLFNYPYQKIVAMMSNRYSKDTINENNYINEVYG